MTRHLATLRALWIHAFRQIIRLYLRLVLGTAVQLSTPRTHCHLVVELHPYLSASSKHFQQTTGIVLRLRTWLRIIHCNILYAFTIP